MSSSTTTQLTCQTCKHWSRRKPSKNSPQHLNRPQRFGHCHSSAVMRDTDIEVDEHSSGDLYTEYEVLVEPHELSTTLFTCETFGCIHHDPIPAAPG